MSFYKAGDGEMFFGGTTADPLFPENTQGNPTGRP
jgi:hypothetical protein